MRIAIFGPTLLSSGRNPYAISFRGLLSALHARGHEIQYHEPEDPDAPCDLAPPKGIDIITYQSNPKAALRAVEGAGNADLLIKTSRAGACGALITEAILDLQRPGCQVVFWDTDPAGTFAAIHQHPESPLHRLIPRFDQILANGGGATAMATYSGFGARRCTVVFPAIDPETYHPVATESRFQCDLALLSDRPECDESKLEEFILNQADQSPQRRFILAGSGWENMPFRPNLQIVGPLSPYEQNCLSASALCVLAIGDRNAGRSPSPRLFEAAGAGACLLTDGWNEIEECFTPEREIIVNHIENDLTEALDQLDSERARVIGDAALRRVLRQHTYAQRALQIERAL